MSEDRTRTGTGAGTTPGTTSGTTYWRSLGQLEDGADPAAAARIEREFPDGIADAPDDVSRRSFLSAVAASVALAGATSCRKPETEILPFNKRPPGFEPGIPKLYATTIARSGFGVGVLVKSSDGRPTKIEGNPDHPSSLGGTDARLQAELLQIYDPNRSRHATGPAGQPLAGSHTDHEGHDPMGAHGVQGPPGHGHAGPAAVLDPDAPYEAFRLFWEEQAKSLRLDGNGAGLHVLMPPTSSPAMAGMIGKLLDVFGEARVHVWDALHRDEALAGAAAAFGKPVEQQVDFAKAAVVASFDCDFLALDGNNLGNALRWAERRRAPRPGEPMPRLYVFESCYSTTGTVADHRFRMSPPDVGRALLALAAELGVGAGGPLGEALAQALGGRAGEAPWARAVAADLRDAGGNCAVVVGPRMPAAVHAVAHAINAHLGAVGTAVVHRPLPEPMQRSAVASIRELAGAIEAGRVRMLVCLGTNPVYDAPADLGLPRLLAEKKVPHVVHLGLYRDETALLADWHFPLAHELESWGDARAHDGTLSLQQPLVAPLHGGVSGLEFLALLAQQPDFDRLVAHRNGAYGLELLREHWRTAAGAADFDAWWRQAVHDGVVANSGFAPEPTSIDAAGVAAAVRDLRPASGFTVQLRPCPKMWDGRYANNSWMQELPDPLTKLSWDNAALLSPATARRLGVENGDMLMLAAGERQLAIAAWVLPGHADECATIYLGWGRALPDECRVATGTGFDGYRLRTTAAQWTVADVAVARTNARHQLVCTQEHGTMAGRAIVREATAEQYRRDPRWAPKLSPLDLAARIEDPSLTEQHLNHSLWQERGYLEGPDARDPDVARSPYQWGMVIDLNACTGCSACVVACVAENNIPMVGKRQVARNREMFWIRADRYFASEPGEDLQVAEDPRVANMPVPCMQCENAPCEAVCPVAATVHSPDGLNDMAYNRCIGTRYCSNNCPYKVRRFNYLDYLGNVPDTKRMAFNPDVTVRSRGVMEKCTYCVQRINGGRIAARLSGRKVGDGEDDVRVVPACAQACPTRAITFGNILESGSAVRLLRGNVLNYGVLSEMNTKPRTTYLGRVRNPNPSLA